MTTAIVVAAGNSSRMGRDKVFAELGGKPVLLHSLEAFANAASVDEIVVVTRPENVERVKALNISKVIAVVGGGASRVQSVLNGLERVRQVQGIVAIHDGARPLVSAALIDSVIAEAKVHRAVIPVIAVKDTVKRVNDGAVESTPSRDELFLAQTPQAFDLELYRSAVSGNSDIHATDDSMLVEFAGVKVRTVPGDERNIKITTEVDLAVAGAWIQDSGFRIQAL